MSDDTTMQIYPNDTDTMPLTATTWPWTVRDSRLDAHYPPAARLVYRSIAARARLKDGRWTAYPSHETVAEDSGVAERYVPRMVRLLERGIPRKGILPVCEVTHRYDERGQQTSNSYLFPAQRMWSTARANIAAKKRELETERKERAAKTDAFLKAGFPVEDLDEDSEDSEDIVAAAARADAACLAASGGDCLTVPGAAATETDGNDADGYDWRQVPEYVQPLFELVRRIYELLGRTDVPEDLMPVLELIDPILDREGGETWDRVMDFALADEKFWKPNMGKSSKKLYRGCPIAYFVANYETIKAQADEADAKAAKKAATLKPSPAA